MKTFFFATTISIFCSISFFETPIFKTMEEGNKESFAIVQLFTSQGCSSCPSADKLLEKVKKVYHEDNVLVLSYHVDYWNRLGWKDPYSKNEFTLLQNAYGFVFNSNRIYTPQAVINGKVQFVGSNEAKMNAHISKFLKEPAKNNIVLSEIKVLKNKISFNYQIQGIISAKELKVALVLETKETAVNRGENKGKKLRNTHIVLDEINIPLLKRKGTSSINISDIASSQDDLLLIGYIQKKDYEITGAVQSEIFNLR